MRHLSLSLLSSALIFYSCSKQPEPEVQEEVFVEESLVTPARSEPVATPAPAPVRKAPTASYTQPSVTPEETVIIDEPLIIQEEEVWVREPEDSSEVKKTYNELQLSDERSDFPAYENPSGRTYNETQISD